MNEVITILRGSLGISERQIKEVLTMLEEGATIPFIARYRKERTGNLDEDQIKKIEEQFKYQNNLLTRKNDVIRLIDEKGLLTDELKDDIMKCSKLSEVEDLYRPYKEKKKTKASEAIKNGLEPLAKIIMSFPLSGDLDSISQKFITENVKDTTAAITGAGYIIAEWISDNASYRKWIRNFMYNNALISSKIKKSAVDENKVYEMYYSFQDRVKYIKHYRVLALNRGEKEGVLSVSLDYDESKIVDFLDHKLIKNDKSFICDIVKSSIRDSLKRLIIPSIEREIRQELTEKSEEDAINTFSINLENLLLTRPIKKMRVLGYDPAFRTGCKLAVLDEFGNPLHIDVIYPTEPHNDKVGSMKKVLELIDKYNINLIAIGNGTASRESEAFIAECIKLRPNVKYSIVSEAGASVYSASELAQKEFPDLSVEKRSAISIGRRIQDPLSELVKIDPKSIGVGEYQHGVNQKRLTESLDFTTSKVVNEVGVNINTASKSILKYVSGLTKSVIENIYKYKEEHAIKNRSEIKKIKGMSDKIYEQSIGFLRVINSDNPLDRTGIHPESYDITNKLLTYLNLDIANINTEAFKEALETSDKSKLVSILNTDIYTLSDIIKELLNPGLDPRDELSAPVLKSDILHIEDLKLGMQLEGTVRNVTSFGAFIDIGLKNDALIHISKMSTSYVSNPMDVLQVGEVITCYVDDVNLEKKKVSLTLLKQN